MKKKQLDIKKIRILILHYLQFRKLVWYFVAGAIGSFFIDTYWYWLLTSFLFITAFYLNIYAVCPKCNKPVHVKIDPNWDSQKKMDMGFENYGRKHCSHCGYAFNKNETREK